MSEQKKQLETAINRTGKAFDALVKEVEKIGSGLTTEMIDQGFVHLANLVELARQRAHFAQQTTNFSFDNPPAAPIVVPPAAQQRLAQGQERLVGQGPRRERPAAPKPPVDPDAEAYVDED